VKLKLLPAGDADSTQQELGRSPRTGSVKQPEINAPLMCMVKVVGILSKLYMHVMASGYLIGLAVGL